MGSNFYLRALRGIPLSVPTGYTHAPGPGGMPTGCSRYLPPWPLCTVCAKTRVSNLLNHTPPTVGTCGSTKTSMGVTGTRLDLWPTQEAYEFPAWLAQQKYTSTNKSPPIIPYHAIPDITVPT